MSHRVSWPREVPVSSQGESGPSHASLWSKPCSCRKTSVHQQHADHPACIRPTQVLVSTSSCGLNNKSSSQRTGRYLAVKGALYSACRTREKKWCNWHRNNSSIKREKPFENKMRGISRVSAVKVHVAYAAPSCSQSYVVNQSVFIFSASRLSGLLSFRGM